MKRIFNLFLTLTLIITLSQVTILQKNSDLTVKAATNEVISTTEAEKARKVLRESLYTVKKPYVEVMKNATINYNLIDVKASLDSTPLLPDADYDYQSYAVQLEYDETAVYTVNVPTTGYYYLNIDYFAPSSTMSDITVNLTIDDVTQFDEMKIINFPVTWKDDSKEFSLDSYGDETLPTQVRVSKWININVNNNTYVTSYALLFKFEAGSRTIKFTNITSNKILLGDLMLKAPKQVPTYDQYKSQHGDNKIINKLEIDAISYSEKNSSYVRLGSVRDPAVKPYHDIDKKLNIIEGVSWKESGQEVLYKIEVKETGLYQIALHYMNEKNDFSVFRTFKLSKETEELTSPFAELIEYELKPTGAGKWKNHTLGDDKGAFQFYLEKDTVYNFSIRSESSPLAWAMVNIQLLIDHINQFSLDVRKITGKDIDTQRTWKITKYLPMTKPYLEYYRTMIIYMQQELAAYSPVGRNSSSLANFSRAVSKLDKMLEKPDELPLYLDELFSGTGSVSSLLGDTISILKDQQLSLDCFYLYNGTDLPRENAGFWEKFSSGVRVFFASFTSKKYVTKKDPEAINVWVNRPITYVDTMQKLVDSTFTSKNGIKVKMSVMPDASKLTLATAAKSGPDVALGLASYMPFDLSIRGAVVPLSDFADFWIEADQFAPGALIPYVLEDKVYAFPETLDFNATFYRTDIFQSLGLTPPDTWDDVLKMVYTLQRYGMNFYHPIAGGGAIKWFYQTSGLIYQHGGSLYSEDGLSTAIDSPEAVEGLKYLIKLFQTYSLPEQVVSFYNSFRYGDLPIGVADFNTYILLKTAAPELVGQWAIAPSPGIKDENGVVQRWYIANGTSGMIMKATKHKQESWEFLKWWMSEETQTAFSYNLQSAYGPTYVWLSANLNAVANSNLDAYDKRIILDQVQWLRDVPRTPGQYMLERGLSQIWNSAIFSGTPARSAIDEQIIVIERELRRKMAQFNYIDTQGNILKPYTIRDIDWIEGQIEAAKKVN
jgi:ABC-type glycerol-3-phosphate transport system substrate-binding protein